MKTRFVTAGLVTALPGAGGMTIQTIQHPAAAGTAPEAAFECSIKYVCGDFARGLDPNPEDPEQNFEQPMPPGPLITPAALPPDFGMGIDGQDIRKKLLPGSPPTPCSSTVGWSCSARSPSTW